MNEEEFVFCYECEENFHCPDAQRKDGCSWGLKIVSDEKDDKMDCRNCKKFESCPCGKDGHESGTSQGYTIGECKDFELQESEVKNDKRRSNSDIT